MAWTAPRTWVANEVVTASLLNTHLRDNLNETAPAKVSAASQSLWSTGANAIAATPVAVYKTANETVNNSASLQDDDHLSFAIAANEVYAVRLALWITNASGAPGFKGAFSVPAGCTGQSFGVYGHQTTTTDGDAQTMAQNAAMSAITANTGFSATYLRANGQIFAFIINGANAGTVQFQWAQLTPVSSNTVLLAGSHMIISRLA